MDDLPRVFVNPIEKDLDNCQTESLADKKIVPKNSKNLSMKIKSIFNSNDYIYKKRVFITTKDYKDEKIVVGKANGYLLTLYGEKIKLSDIYDIEVI